MKAGEIANSSLMISREELLRRYHPHTRPLPPSLVTLLLNHLNQLQSADVIGQQPHLLVNFAVGLDERNDLEPRYLLHDP